ncbi:MAG: DoxX family protein [Ginsengibacter sp.]|jgi:uncharacterized membrane protein YphA (DoxX/SURF4 family)
MFIKNLSTQNSVAITVIRLMVGIVFLSEGLQKFLFPALRGSGRFENIGFPFPEFIGPFVGSFEIICGLLVLFGLFTRFASIPLLIIMLTALLTTKLPILINDGFWEMMHASRTDWAMLLGSIFLIIQGGGKYSIDRLLLKEKNEHSQK